MAKPNMKKNASLSLHMTHRCGCSFLLGRIRFLRALATRDKHTIHLPWQIML